MLLLNDILIEYFYAFNSIDWSLISWEEIQQLIDEGDLFEALVLLVTELISQGLPFFLIKNEAGDVTDIVYREEIEGSMYYIPIYVKNREEIEKSWMQFENVDAVFLWKKNYCH